MKRIYSLVFCLCAVFMFAQDQVSAKMIREMISQDVKNLNIKPENIFKTENKMVDGIPVRLYFPDASKHKKIIYNIHGGALIGGDLETHENISRKLANKTQSVVIALDYRKAPENPFPKSLEDVAAVYRWIIKNQKEITGNSQPISVVGDSGGALLAAALQVKIKRDDLLSNIAKVVYVNPAFDVRNPGNALYAKVAQWYLAGSDANSELASPMVTKDFSVFVPCLIIENEKDILLAQAKAFEEKLKLAKVPYETVLIPNEDHFGGLWAAAHPRTDLAFDRVAAFLNR